MFKHDGGIEDIVFMSDIIMKVKEKNMTK